MGPRLIRDADFHDDPYPTFAALRETDPVHVMAPGMWLVTRYADVRLAQADARFGKDLTNWRGYAAYATQQWGGVDSPFARHQRQMFVFMDDPEHARLRTLVGKAFRVRAVETMRPEIERRVAELLGARESFDAVTELAVPLSIGVICSLLGVPDDHVDTCEHWVELIARAFVPLPDRALLADIDVAIDDAHEYFAGLLADRRRSGGDDLMTLLADAEEQGDRLSSDEIIGTAYLLFAAGHETTAALIGNGLKAFADNPDQWKLLVEGAVPPAQAVEEMLRYDPPFPMMRKVALETVELSGTTVPEGDLLILAMAAGNRDPRAFDDPERFDITRHDIQSLSFGYGAHFCLGAALARIEAECVLEALVQRGGLLSIGADGPRRMAPSGVRGFASLPVQLRAPAGAVT